MLYDMKTLDNDWRISTPRHRSYTATARCSRQTILFLYDEAEKKLTHRHLT